MYPHAPPTRWTVHFVWRLFVRFLQIGVCGDLCVVRASLALCVRARLASACLCVVSDPVLFCPACLSLWTGVSEEVEKALTWPDFDVSSRNTYISLAQVPPFPLALSLSSQS